MTKSEVEHALKEILGVKKDIVALKPLREFPAEIPRYEGLAAPGLCVQIGEVLREGGVFYTTRENHQCYEGLVATGVCELSRDDFRAAMEEILEDFPAHRDVATAVSFYEKCIESIPPPPVDNACLVVGPLGKIEDPDLVLIFCTPKQADIIARINAYLGELTEGFSGSGGCLFNIRLAFRKRVPTFSTGDTSWRLFTGLSENELTVTVPYERLLEIAPHIKFHTDYVNSFADLF